MSQSHTKVIQIVKNYIYEAGGLVPIEDLLRDYETTYGNKLPFVDFGFRTLWNFFDSMDLVVCEDCHGKMYVESCGTKQRKNEMDDMKQLTIQMRNSLQLDDRNNDRIVTMRTSDKNTSSEEFPSRTNSWPSNRTEDISSDGSLRSLLARGPLRNASTHQCPEDNLSGPRSNNHSTLKNVPIFSLESRSNTGWPNCDAPGYPFTNERRVSNIHILGTPESSSMQPNMNLYGANINPLDGCQTEDPKGKVWTLDGLIAYSSGMPLNDVIELRKMWDASTPTLLGTDASFPHMSASSLPENCDTHTFQSTSTCKDPISSASNWTPEEMCKSSSSVHLTNDEMVDRIVKIVNSTQSFGGISTRIVESKYREKYSMTLPQSWLSLLEERGVLYLEIFTMFSLVYPSRFFPVPPTMSSLPALQYRKDHNFWNVHLTLYESTTCVWFRLKDELYDQQYEILKREMNRHYMNVAKKLKNLAELSIGQLCAVNYRNQWSRSEVRESDIVAGCVKCFLLDEGRSEKFPRDSVYALHEKFTNTPALIIQGELYSLEKWENCQYINNKVKQYIPEECDVTIKIHQFLGRNRVSFRMNVETEEGATELNFKMADFARTMLNLPILFEGHASSIFILKIVDSNCLKIHIDSPALRKLKKTLDKATDAVKDPKMREPARVIRSSQISTDKIYLILDDAEWKRIECLRQSSESQFHARFIDYAEEKHVYLHDIFDISLVPDTVRFIEPQVVQIKVLDADMVALRNLEQIHLRHSPPLQISFVMKILHLGNIPLVQLLVEIQGSNKPLQPITNFFDSL